MWSADVHRSPNTTIIFFPVLKWAGNMLKNWYFGGFLPFPCSLCGTSCWTKVKRARHLCTLGAGRADMLFFLIFLIFSGSLPQSFLLMVAWFLAVHLVFYRKRVICLWMPVSDRHFGFQISLLLEKWLSIEHICYEAWLSADDTAEGKQQGWASPEIIRCFCRGCQKRKLVRK